MSSTNPQVSVVLPFFNAASTLDRAIDSIARQDHPRFECVLIDNNSSDGSRRIAEAWVRRDSRFLLLNEARQGVMFASNRGSQAARGAYIARMDADDVAMESRLSLQAAFLDKHPGYGAVAGRVRHVGDPETTGGFQRFVEWSNSLISHMDIFNSRFIEAPIVNPSAMWRREVQENHGLYRHGDFPEDYEMWLRWLDQGVKIAKVPEVVLEWHDSTHRLTRTHAIYSEQAFYEVKSRYLAHWLSGHNPHHPQVLVWGASRISRRRARYLEQLGVQVKAYVDTKGSRQLDREVIYYQDLPLAGEAFVLTYIRQMDNRDRIRTFLEERGYVEGKDYLMVS